MSRLLTIEQISKMGINIYAVVRTLAKRAGDLNRVATPLLLKPKSKNPASIVIESLRGYLLKVMLIDSIGIVTATSFFIYLIIGTLWRSIVSHSVIFF